MTNTVWEELNPLSGPKNYLRAFSWSISETCTVKYHIQQAQTCLRTWWPTATECPVHLLPKRTEKNNCPAKCKVLKETPRHALTAYWSTVSGAVSYDRYTELVWFYLAIIYVRNTLMNGNISLRQTIRAKSMKLEWKTLYTCTFTAMWEERFGKSFL